MITTIIAIVLISILFLYYDSYYVDNCAYLARDWIQLLSAFKPSASDLKGRHVPSYSRSSGPLEYFIEQDISFHHLASVAA